LTVQSFPAVRLAPKTTATYGTAPQSEVHAGVLKRRQDGLLNLIERQRAASYPMRQLLERSGYLPDASSRVLLRTLPDRVRIDDSPQDQGIVGIEPERLAFLGRQGVDRRGGQCGQPFDIAIESGAIALKRAVVDKPVSDVQIQRVVEQLAPGRLRTSILSVRC